MNKVILIGNLTKEPETKTTQGGKEMTKFTLAINSTWEKDEDGKYKTDFFNCIAWGKTAEIAAKYLRKGSKTCIEGSISNTNWDKADGTKGYGVQINISNLELLPSSRESRADDSYIRTTDDEPKKAEVAQENDMPEVNIDDLPF